MSTEPDNAADFLLDTMSRPESRLYRTYRNGKAHLEACLEDYAYLSEALIDLYEAMARNAISTKRSPSLSVSLKTLPIHDQGGFFTTGIHHESLILRSREGPDGATPSGNAVAAAALSPFVLSLRTRRFSRGGHQGHSSVWTPDQPSPSRIC